MHALLTEYFADPLFLLSVLTAVPLYFLLRQSVGRVLFSSTRLVPAQSTSWRAALAWVPHALIIASMAMFGVALAGPRIPDAPIREEREGVAIMMVLDRSGSMRALDLSEPGQEQTRLDVVKAVFHDFVAGGNGLAGRPDDALGLVSFARYVDSSCPLTTDHSNLLQIADDVEIVEDRNEDGTALGDALGLAVERLRESDAKSRVVILLTDGVQNAGEDTPADAARVAARLGIKVYTVGAGTNGFAPVRVEDPFSGRTVLRQMPVEIDEATLQEVADITGGKYFRATDAAALQAIYRAIDELEKTRIVTERLVRYRDVSEVPISVAALLVSAGWLLGASVFRRFP